MIKNISFSVVSNILTQLVLFVVFLISAKLFGPEGRGVFSATVSMVTLVGSLVGLSIGRVSAHNILQEKKTPLEYFKNRFFNLLVIYGLSVVLGYIVLLLVAKFSPSLFGGVNFIYILIVFTSLPYFIWNSYSSFIFSSLNETLWQNKRSLVIRLFFLSATVVCWMINFISLQIFVTLFSISNILNLILDQYYIRKRVHYDLTVDWKYIKKLVLKSAQIHLDTIGYILYSSLMIVVINMYLPLAEVGYFNFASQLISMIIVIPTIVSQFVNGYIVSSGPDEFWVSHKKIILFTLLVCLGVTITAYLLLPILISVLKLKFSPSLPIFNLLLFTVIPNAFTILMSPQWLSRGYFKTVSFITILTGLAGFLFFFLTVNSMGIKAAVFVNYIIYFTTGLINILFCYYLNKKKDRIN